jgi:RHS repeat-associated protein
VRVDGTLYYVLKDHLGSASVVTEDDGDVAGEQRYYPFGETRFTTGTMLTDKLFTSQREISDLGIYHFNARFYSPTLGRFLSADTIVPGYTNPQNLNRFSYTLNNPLKYTDPTGHWVLETDDPIREQRRNANRHREERERNRRERNRAYALYHVQSDTNLYQLGWQNFGAAWSIYTNSNATISQRAGAGFYMGAWGGAHAGLVVGGTILAWEAVAPGSMSCIGNPACQQEVQRIITNTQITGRMGQPINLQGSSPATINGFSYSGHAIDRMLGNGIPPSAVQNVVQNYAPGPGNLPNTLAYFDPVNNIRVITNATTPNIITLGYGPP